MKLLNELEAAGRMDPRWGLPLGKDGGKDNFPVTTAMFCELATADELEVMHPRFKLYLTQAQVYDPAGRKIPGLFHREGGNPAFNSVDNYIGIVRCCQVLDLPEAIHDIYDHGAQHDWIFNNRDPHSDVLDEFAENGAKEWFGRFLGFPIYVKSATGRPLSWWDQWKFSQMIQTDAPQENSLLAQIQQKPDVGNHLLQWHENRGMKGAGGILLSAWQKAWVKRMSKLYPGGLGEMARYYFGPDSRGPNPLGTQAWGMGFE